LHLTSIPIISLFSTIYIYHSSEIRNFIFDEFVRMRVEVYRQKFKLLPSFKVNLIFKKLKKNIFKEK